MSRCLITGANGFLGGNLAQTLRSADWEVRGLVRDPVHFAALRQIDVEPALGTLHDHALLDHALQSVDVVFHVAGRTRALNRRQFRHDNVEGTENVVQAAARRDTPPLIVLISSLAAGGPTAGGVPRSEDQPPRPISAYGWSKLEAEAAASAMAARIPLSIVRPPVIFGPADRAGLAMYHAMKLLPMHASPGWPALDLSVVYVGDLCDAIERVALKGERVQAPASGRGNAGVGAYYVAGERSITYGEMGWMAATAAGWAVAVVPVPRLVFWGVAAGGEIWGRLRGQPSMLNWDKVREATARDWLCDDAKIRRQLGYRPSATLENQFAQTVAWYRANKWI